MPPSHIQIWGLSSAHIDFGETIRKSKTMVQLQVAMSAIAKSRILSIVLRKFSFILNRLDYLIPGWAFHVKDAPAHVCP